MTSPGYWRNAAKQVILRCLAEARDRNLTPHETLALIDQRYPFGLRDHYPYQVWLDERKNARVRLGLLPATSIANARADDERGTLIAAVQTSLFDADAEGR